MVNEELERLMPNAKIERSERSVPLWMAALFFTLLLFQPVGTRAQSDAEQPLATAETLFQKGDLAGARKGSLIRRKGKPAVLSHTQ